MKIIFLLFSLVLIHFTSGEECQTESYTGCNPSLDTPDSTISIADQYFTPQFDGTVESITVYIVPTGTESFEMLLSDGTSNEAYGQATASSAGPVTFIIDNGNGYPFVSGVGIMNTKCAGNLQGQTYSLLYSINVLCPSSTSGDPHFYGFRQQKYDVMGQSYETYNLITAPYLQINSRFTPYYKTKEQILPTGTMMGELGIKFNEHRFYVNSNSTLANLENKPVSLDSNWNYTFGDIELSNEVNRHMYAITVATPDLTITFTRKVYRVNGLEEQWHLDYKANTLKVNKEFHGLLGQTWEDKVFEHKEGAFKYLDGGEDDYRIRSNDIFGNDFLYNRFINV